MKGLYISKNKYSVSLFSVIIILISIVSFFIMIVTSYVFTSTYNKMLMDTAVTNSEQVSTQVAQTMNRYYDDLKDTLEIISNQISTSKTNEEAKSNMDSMIKMRSDIASIVVYDNTGNILEYSADGKVLKKNIENNLSFDKQLFSADQEFYMTNPHVENMFLDEFSWVVTIAEKRVNSSYGNEVIVSMDMKFSSMASYVGKVGIGKHGYCFVINNSGAIIYHPQQQLIFSQVKSENISGISDFSDGSHIKDGKIYALTTLNDGLWKIVGVSYTQELVNAKFQEALVFASVIVLSGIFVVIFVSVLFLRVITRPIENLVNAMKEFETNAKQFEYDPMHSVKEINSLSESFHHMVFRVQELMNKVENEEIILRKTELKALQAQINPHFLYNTLESIQWMCEQEKTPEAVKMVGALAQLFRISINRGNEFVTIEKEIQHAESYLLIQSFRYKNQFKYYLNIDESVTGYLCNKITLQPFIENAICHGISSMIDEGEIVITVGSCGDDIVMTVADNGLGMSSETRERILKKDLSHSDGIGVKNVNDRLKIYFGEQYGVKISSVLDEGTVITIRFPKITEANNET